MAARVYSLNARGLTIANAAVTLAFINPSSTVGFEVLRVVAGCSANANAVMQEIQLVSQVTAFPTLTSSTPKKTVISDPASAFTGGTAGAAGTSGVNASAEGAGAKTVMHQDAFNSGGGPYLWLPTEQERLVFGAGQSSGFGVYLPVAAPVLTNWFVSVTFREIG